MTPELTDKLLKKYPEQFKNLKGIECDDGWYDIIANCCYIIDQYMKGNIRKKDENLDFYWTQQKSKFAGLRLYSSGANDFISGVIRMSEAISYSICQFCGNKGVRCHRGFWVETLCDKCRIENNYEICKKENKPED